jgi:hypothetical protein
MNIEKEMEALFELQKEQPKQRTLLAGDKDTDIFQSILGDLKDAVISKVKKKATGWIMNLVGLGPGPEPKNEVKEALEKQYQELKVIEGKIDALSSKLNEAIEVFKTEIDGAKYYTATQVLNPAAANIDAAFERLQIYARLEPGAGSKLEMDELAATIRATIPNAFITIKNNLLGTPSGGENMTSLGTRVAFKAAKSVDEYAEMIHMQFMYYYGLQLKALMLIIEAYHYNGTPAVAQNYYNTYVGNMNDEVKVYVNFVPKTSLQNKLELDTDVIDILPQGDNVYLQCGMQVTNPKFITIRAKDAQKINELIIPDVRLNWTLAEKDGFAYTASMSQSDSSRWDINKIALGNTPNVVGRLSYSPPGSGWFKAAFLMGYDIDGDYLYAMFNAMGVEGFTIKVINLKTFAFEADLYFPDPLQSAGSPRGNGLRVKNGKLYIMAWFSSDKFTSLKVVDIKTQKVTDTVKADPQSANGAMAPITIKDNLLYCTAYDTQLRIYDLNQSPPALTLLSNINIFMQNIIVDGNLIYINSHSNMQDTRGDLMVVYWAPKSGASQKTMKVGNGITALSMDKTHLYGGAGGGEKTLYILGYAHNPNNLIIPVDPVLAGSLPM